MISLIRRGPETNWEKYSAVTRSGKLYTLPSGSVVELFSVGVLAEAVERKSAAVVQWEKTGKLPMPTVKLPGNLSQLRRYTGTQVVFANNLLRYMEIPLNGGGEGRGKGHTIGDFLAAYAEWFRIPDVQLDPESGTVFHEAQYDLGGGTGKKTGRVVLGNIKLKKD